MVAVFVALLLSLPNTKATVDVPGTWTKLDDKPALVAAYKGPAGLVLAITRAQVPNSDAWRSKTRDAYAGEVAKGALARVPGGKELAKKLGETNGVPVLDLELRTKDGATLVLRYLLFRTYALVLAIEVPKGSEVSTARAIARTFSPPKAAP